MSDTKLPDYTLTTFNSVIIDKTKLLETLKTNRANHDEIYRAACSGFWVNAREVFNAKTGEFALALEKSRIDYDKSVKGLTNSFDIVATGNDNAVNNQMLGNLRYFPNSLSFNVNLNFNGTIPTVYPATHVDSYDKIIRLLDMSVADKATLTVAEFDMYVMDNWTWYKDFASTNSLYVSKYVDNTINNIFNLSGISLNSAQRGSVSATCSGGMVGSNLSNFVTTNYRV